MKKALVVISLYLALAGEASALQHRRPAHLGPIRSYSGPGPFYYQTQFYHPQCAYPTGYDDYQSHFAPYYQSGAYLTQQARAVPLGWNRYYLAARMQPPYSIIIRNSLPYSSYREADSEPAPQPGPSKQPVTIHTIPARELPRPVHPASPPPAGQSGGPASIQISQGMTEVQVKTQLGSPMMQVVLGDTRTYVYDRFIIEFDKGRVKNVAFK